MKEVANLPCSTNHHTTFFLRTTQHFMRQSALCRLPFTPSFKKMYAQRSSEQKYKFYSSASTFLSETFF